MESIPFRALTPLIALVTMSSTQSYTRAIGTAFTDCPGMNASTGFLTRILATIR